MNIAWVLGIEGAAGRYFIHYDSFMGVKIKQNNKAGLLKLDVVNRTFETEEGIFTIITKYSNFLELENINSKA